MCLSCRCPDSIHILMDMDLQRESLLQSIFIDVGDFTWKKCVGIGARKSVSFGTLLVGASGRGRRLSNYADSAEW